MSKKELAKEISFLWQQMKVGKAFLLLGAGASAASLNSSGQKIKQSRALARALAEKAGLPYSDEDLPDVVQAVVGRRLSEVQWRDFLRGEFVGSRPSQALRALFGFSWARAYSFNIDDAVERIGRPSSGQHLIAYNARTDRAATKDERNPSDLHLVHLNGEANKPEHGLIFSRDEYSEALNDENPWYEELATDYYRFTPVIIGSRLNEPLLDVELDRMKRREGKGGAAFLVVPDQLTPIQAEVLASRNIFHIEMSLEEFVDLARHELGDIVSVGSIATGANEQISASMLASLTPQDINAALAVYPISYAAQQSALRDLADDFQKLARDFLLGAPATWPIAASDVPVELAEGRNLVPFITESVAQGHKMIVVTGAAGSGKSTLVKQALLRMLKDDRSSIVYDLRGEAHSFNRVFSLLRRIHPDRRVFVHLDSLYVYGDKLSADLEAQRDSNIVVVTSARSGEWRERFERHFWSMAVTYELRRFSEADYAPLANRILRYVPSPSFSRATPEARLEKFQKSRRQLLIALREITESKKFDEVIRDEYAKLPDEATRFLFRVVGVSTLSRVGLDRALAKDIYGKQRFNRSFESALLALEGIVVMNAQARLQVRHELYVEYIFKHTESLENYLQAVIAILTALSRYQVPLITSLSRIDAQLFKYLLNYRSLMRRARAQGRPKAALKVYERFEKAFEQDGHFWLQYALYVRNVGDVARALDLLDKSIQAYPDNPQAIHARADLKLRIAAEPITSHELAQAYIDEAVADLLRLDARQDARADLYPIVTLADKHVGALIRRGRTAEAKERARGYFAQVRERERIFRAPILSRLMANLLKFATTGVWVQTEYSHFDD